MATLYIVRHGDTDYNASEGEERIRGWSDVPLDDDGKKEARRAGERLKAKKPTGIRASDLPRARETAEIIGHIVGLEPQFDVRLRTLDTGKFTGELCDDVQSKVDTYVRQPDTPIPGNAKFKGESFDAFSERIFAGFADALEQFGDRVIVITHHSPVSLLEAWCEAGRPADYSLDIDAYLNNDDEPGSITIFRTTVAELRGEPEPAAQAAEPELEDHGDAIGLAENPAGIRFHCGGCEYFKDGTCHFKDKRLYGRKVEPEWCCNKFDHPGMRVIVP
jgi:broad specificity phosphatase PhoE